MQNRAKDSTIIVKVEKLKKLRKCLLNNFKCTVFETLNVSLSMKKNKEKLIQMVLIIATFAMIILRFLWNEKGRVNPDSIRYMRTSKVFPTIDNTTTPLGYPLSLKFFTFF